MKKDLTDEVIIKNVKEIGYDIFEIEKPMLESHCCHYIHIIDKKGYKYRVRYSNLYNSRKNVKPVSKFNPYSIDNIKIYLINNKATSELISTEYLASDSLLIFKCECGNLFKRSWDSIKSDDSYKFFCTKCALKFRGISRRENFVIVKRKFEESGLKLLAKQEDYKGNSRRMLCEDEYGYRGLTSYNHLNRIKSSGRTGIEYFSYKHNRENLFYNLNNYCKINNIASKPIKISEEQKYAKMAITFQCSCGNYFDTTINSFRTWKHKCDKCSGNVSSFELKTKEFLNKYKIEFTIEKRFNDCKNNLPLPFDFYIKSKNLIIEIDGQGHFRPTHFNSCSNEDAELSYKLTRINDKIKNKYCKDNNINLIRIPYWEFETEQYKITLLENVVNN